MSKGVKRCQFHLYDLELELGYTNLGLYETLFQLDL